MKKSREDVRAYVIEVFRSLEEDPASVEEYTEDTFLMGDRNWRSIDVIYLANTMMEHYGQEFPFTDLFTEIGQREVKDISLGEWVDFIHRNLAPSPAPALGEAVA
jgi:hypothetical protein